MTGKEALSSQPNDLHRQAEEIAAKMTESLEALSPEETRQMLHELRVHQIELEMRNEELHRALKAERKRGKRFRLMFMNAPMPYQSLDENGNFIEVNKTFLDVLGYTREELIGRNFGDLLHPNWVAHFKENFPRFKAIGEILGVEFEMVKKSGTTSLVSFNGKIQRDDQGHFQRTHCIFQDITERNRAEVEKVEREAQNRQIQKAESLGVMAGAIAHHFNNQLQVVMGNLELAIMNLPPRPDADKNLTTNAWESICDNRGIIKLTIKAVSHANIPVLKRFPIDWQPQERVYACLEVADTGCGIAIKDIEKIFDPFFTTKFTGRGLGLPVVLGIAGAHGGGVTVESRPGLGSVFRVFFPVIG